tara:strand:- start:183 stop:515 length:333 start_codon:yes stop_codon:yes gene_type:complete
VLLRFWVLLSVLSTLFPRVSNAKTCPRGRTDGAGKTGQPPHFKGRVRVEHSIAGVKVFRSVRDIHRNFKAGFEDSLIDRLRTAQSQKRLPHRSMAQGDMNPSQHSRKTPQ